MSPTYRDHAELAAVALTRLLSAPTPAAAPDVDQMLHCREIMLTSLTDRMTLLGLPAPAGRRATAVALRKEPTVTPLAESSQEAISRLHQVLTTRPRLAADRRTSPVDTLTGPAADPTVELWRVAAAQLLAGTHTLDSSTEKPWVTDHGAAWWLLKDVAVAIEALTVLDEQLQELGVLSDLEQTDKALTPAAQRLITSQVTRQAHWSATSDAGDLAEAAAPIREPSLVIIAARPVNQPGDLAPAQRALAGYLRVYPANQAGATPDIPHMDAVTARALVMAQHHVATVCSQWASQLSGTEMLVADFDSRAAVLGDVLSNLRLVEDQAPTRGGSNPAALMQTTEITRAMRTLRAQARIEGTPPVNAAQLADLASASHTTCHALGVALRRELTRPDSSLRYTEPALADDARRTAPTRVSPVNVAANALVNLQPPNRPVSDWIAPSQRNALRTTLDNTPPTGTARFPGLAPRGHRPGVDR